MVDGVTVRQELGLVPPPDIRTSQADFEEQFAFLCRIRDQVSAIHAGVNTANRALEELRGWEARTERTPREAEAREACRTLRESLEEIRERLVQSQVTNFQDEINFPPRLNSQVIHLFGVAASADARPTSQAYEAFAVLEKSAGEVLGRLRDLTDHAFPAFAAKMAECSVPAIRVWPRNRESGTGTGAAMKLPFLSCA